MTTYNGSKDCTGCGGQISPVAAMLSTECEPCRRARLTKLMKNRMVP